MVRARGLAVVAAVVDCDPVFPPVDVRWSVFIVDSVELVTVEEGTFAVVVLVGS